MPHVRSSAGATCLHVSAAWSLAAQCNALRRHSARPGFLSPLPAILLSRMLCNYGVVGEGQEAWSIASWWVHIGVAADVPWTPEVKHAQSRQRNSWMNRSPPLFN